MHIDSMGQHMRKTAQRGYAQQHDPLFSPHNSRRLLLQPPVDLSQLLPVLTIEHSTFIIQHSQYALHEHASIRSLFPCQRTAQAPLAVDNNKGEVIKKQTVVLLELFTNSRG
jgi:hypothetical protein